MRQIGRETTDDGGVPDPQPTPPKGYTPPATSPGNRAQTFADQGRPLPILYGKAKLQVHLVEKYFPTAVQPPAWGTGQTKVLNDVVQNGNNVYTCTLAGTTGSSGGPTGTATSGIVDGTCQWGYLQQMPYPRYLQVFLGALCEGEIEGAATLFFDKQTFANGALDTKFNGQPGQAVWVGPDAATQSLPSQYDNAINYQHTALVGASANGANFGIYSGTQEELPDMAVVVQGPRFGAASVDPSPADVVNDLLTHVRRGCGWPGSRVDSSITGSAAGGYRVYCDAAGFRFSLVLDQQRTALSILGDILTATNSDAVWSGGALKVIPLGDQPIASPVYGATGYVPANTAQYNLTADDFLDQQQPVQVYRRSDTDCFNAWPVEYIDRAARYVKLTVDDPDQVDVDARGGLRRADTTTLPVVFPDGTYVTALSRILAQRSLKVRNTYTFRLSWKYMLLEPTDIVTLTDSVLGLSATPVRILTMEENEDGFTCTAEDYPAGVQASVAYQPAQGDGYKPTAEKVTSQALPSSVDGSRVGIQSGQVEIRHLAPTSFDNLFPNPTSENAPPTNADTTTAEWANRYNAGGSAYSGSWVRRVTGSNVYMQAVVPASPGDSYYLEAQVRAVTAGANKGGYVLLQALDSGMGNLGFVLGNANATATYALSSVSYTMPAGTCYVAFVLHTQSDAAADAYFDAIYARRVIVTPLLAAGGTDASKLSLSNWANLFPNGNSENAAPAGADTSTAEWKGLYNLGAGAYVGSWVRRITGAASPSTNIVLTLPCIPGDSFFFSAYVKAVVAGANKGGGLGLDVTDASGTSLLSPASFSSENDTTTWTRVTCSVTAPAGAVYLKAYLINGTDAAADAYYDILSLKLMIEPETIMGSGGGVVVEQSWQGPIGYNNSWANYGTPLENVGYMKDSHGFVHLRGGLKSGTINASALTLPVGYRPSARVQFAVSSNDAFGLIQINSDGTIVPAVGSNVYFVLDGIAFDTR